MKIGVFENEFDSVIGSFETANLLNYDNTLEIEWFPSSQKADDSKIKELDVIFVDIDLSSKSELDGYSLVKKIYLMDPKLIKKIIILTGNNKIEESLFQRGIEPSSVSIIIKPSNYEEITKYINKIIGAK